MKTIIAGSRSINNLEPVLDAVIKSEFEITHIISGGALGVDTIAIYIAGLLQLPYPDIYYANWGKGSAYDNSAGYKRNELMANNADALIAVWDGKSNGTKHMIDIATRKNLKIFVHRI